MYIFLLSFIGIINLKNIFMKKLRLIGIVLVSLLLSMSAYSQSGANSPFKTDINKADIRTVLKAVADWQVNTPLTHNLGDWTNGALYAGMVEWAGIAGNDTYYEWLKGISEKLSWDYYIHDNARRRYHADDYCVGQTYVELYRKYKDKDMIKPMRTYLDNILKDPAMGELDFTKKVEGYSSQQRWSWCDALFMAPTVWAKMGNVTGKKKYFDFMYQEYKFSTDYLYDKDEHLFYRDSRYFTMKEANGEKVFWGRGNGWVFAGLPIIIRELPSKYEHKDFFITV